MKDNKDLNSAVFMIVLIDYKIVHSTISRESWPETMCHTMSDEQQPQKAVAIVTRETQPLFSDCNCNALTDIHGLCRQKLYTIENKTLLYTDG